MENEEPNFVVPRPFPHEPSEMLERSTSLDVTPERVFVKKSRLQRKRDVKEDSEASGPLPVHVCHPPQPLAMPQLNSTTLLLDRIASVKQVQQKLAQDSTRLSAQAPPSGCVQELEGVVVNQMPLKEVNVPRGSTRYKDLISLGISDDSFQKLTFKPRMTRRTKQGATPPQEPDIKDLLVPSLEYEEADWNQTSIPLSEHITEPVTIDSDDMFALHSFMKSLQ